MTARIFCLSGFPTGDNVCLTLASTTASQTWDAPTEGWGIPDSAGETLVPDGDASVSIAIAQRSPQECAPEAIRFEATVTGFLADGSTGGAHYDDRAADLVYLWDFGDGNADYSAPVNGLAVWKDGNVGRGPRPVHVYRDPGSYTVALTVVEPASGRIASTTFALAPGGDASPVGDFAALYPAKTFSVGASGADYTTIGAAIAARSGAGAICLELADERFEVGDLNLRSNGGSGTPNVLLKPQPGAHPVLCHSEGAGNGTYLFRTSGDNADLALTFQGITFEGDWDAVRQAATSSYFDRPAFNMAAGPLYVLFSDCTVTGYSTFYFDSTGYANPNGMVTTHNTAFDGFRDVVFYVAGCAGFASLGCRFVADPDAMSGGAKNAPFNNHCPIRFNHEYACDIYLDGNDFFNRFGWPPAGSYRGIQSAIRWNQYQKYPGTFGFLWRNALEGSGANVLVMTPMNQDGIGSDPATYQVMPQQMIIDACHFRTGDQVKSAIRCASGGLTIRNCIMEMPDTSRQTAIGAPLVFVDLCDSYAFGNGDYDSRTDPVKIYNNTLVNGYTSAHGGVALAIEKASASWTDVTAENNILHQPQLAPADDWGLLSTTPIWTARDKGYRHGYTSASLVLTQDVAANGGTLTVDYADFDLPVSAPDIEQSAPVHQATVQGVPYPMTTGFDFGASSVTLTNNSATRWNAGQFLAIGLRIDPDCTLGAFIDGTAPASAAVPAYAPQSGPALNAAASGLRAYEDFAQRVRDGAQPGTIDAGAHEV